jgi:hypothetical protein
MKDAKHDEFVLTAEVDFINQKVRQTVNQDLARAGRAAEPADVREVPQPFCRGPDGSTHALGNGLIAIAQVDLDRL